MALNPINMTPKQSGGKWGLLGKIIGGAAGAIGGSFIGQPQLGFQAGSMLGGTIGEASDPAKMHGGQGVNLIQSAVKTDPEMQNMVMSDAQSALKDIPGLSVEDHKSLHDQFELAKQRNDERLRMALGAG